MDKWLRSNTFVKVMSVTLAVMLYIAVNDPSLGMQNKNQSTATVIHNVGLDAELNDRQFAVVEMPQTVNLTLRGNSFLLNRVAVSNYHVFVDLTNFGAGVHRNVPVKVEGLPEGIEYVTDPSNVKVVLEEKQQKEMEVKVETVGQPEEGYTIGTPTVSPEKVLVRASESRLKDIALVKAVVNISGTTETVKESVELKAYNEAGEAMEGVEINQPTADVEVPITSPYKEVLIRPQVEELPPNGYSVNKITLSENKVTVFGKKDVLDELEVYPGPELDLSGVTRDRTFEMKIPLIKGVDRVDPETIELEVEIVSAERDTFEDLSVEVRGLPDGWKADFVNKEDEDVSVTLEGAPERVEGIGRGDVQPYIDVSDLKPGEHEVEVKWDVPHYIKPIETEKNVQVELQEGS